MMLGRPGLVSRRFGSLSYKESGIGLGAVRNASQDMLALARYCGACDVSSLDKVDNGHKDDSTRSSRSHGLTEAGRSGLI
jgi:hypothetical protein